MSNRKEELGKGIRALLEGIDQEIHEREDTTKAPIPASRQKTVGTQAILLERIEINPFQPRMDFDTASLEELADSIRVHGVIQPITVRRIENEKFQLIAGERRLRASKIAGLTEIPAYIRSANDQESLEIALIENIHREDLNPIEIGINYQRLIDECDLSHDALAGRVGKKRTTVTNYLRILKLPPEIQKGIKEQRISIGHAKALLAVADPMWQLQLYKDIVAQGLSVRQVEAAARKGTTKRKTSSNEIPLEIRRIQDSLTSNLSTHVRIKPKKKGQGEIVISYYTNTDLERLIELLGR